MLSHFLQFLYSLAFEDAQVIQPFSRGETDDTDNTDDADDIDYTYDRGKSGGDHISL